MNLMRGRVEAWQEFRDWVVGADEGSGRVRAALKPAAPDRAA